MASIIPEGYELLVGRSREHALKALATADERGLPSDSVLSVHEGFLIPLAGEETSEEKTAKATATAPRARIGTYSFIASLLACSSRRHLWADFSCNRMGSSATGGGGLTARRLPVRSGCPGPRL